MAEVDNKTFGDNSCWYAIGILAALLTAAAGFYYWGDPGYKPQVENAPAGYNKEMERAESANQKKAVSPTRGSDSMAPQYIPPDYYTPPK